MVWERLGSTSVTSTAANTSWKELDRVTLSSTADELDTSTFTTKDNIMLLVDRPSGSGNVTGKVTYNGDTGSNYAIRWSDNGASDGNGGSRSNLDAYYGQGNNEFGVHNIVNISSQEKLGINNIVESNSSGAGNAPSRYEIVNKWANTSAQINRIQFTNTGTGDFSSGTEVVVLGFDNDEADSGTNFWQELANVNLSSAADEISTGTIASKKYIMWEYHVLSSGAANGLDNISFRFNNDSGNNYCYRHNDNGGSDGTVTNNSKLRFRSGGATAQDFFGSGYIVNKSDKEKLLISEQIYNGGDGASSKPKRAEMVGKWTNTSAQITEIDLIQDGAGSFLTGSYLKVWGSD